MGSLSLDAMRSFLSQSISSLNANKLNGLMAEIDFRNHLAQLGFAERVSAGGWIARSSYGDRFGSHTVVLFPELIQVDSDYPYNRQMPQPSLGLHTICSTFHQLGIHAYYAAAVIPTTDNPTSVAWNVVQLGIPTSLPYTPFPGTVTGFQARGRRHTWLRYNTDTSRIPEPHIPEEFSKENLRVCFQSAFMSEMSDVDGVFWGQRRTYPVEIKEKTAAHDGGIGEYFGLDVGPFVKLAFYAAKHGSLHSLFVVREIDTAERRGLVTWWAITFDQLAQFASWVQRSGGRSMTGGASAVVRIPKKEFQELNVAYLDGL